MAVGVALAIAVVDAVDGSASERAGVGRQVTGLVSRVRELALGEAAVVGGAVDRRIVSTGEQTRRSPVSCG